MKTLKILADYNLGRKESDTGRFGDMAEMAIKDYCRCKVKVARVGVSDLRKHNVTYEIKTGAGELGADFDKLLSSGRYVIYIPVVDESKSIDEQVGYVFVKADFITALVEANMLRSCPNGHGQWQIQTFYNRSKGAPTSVKKYKLWLATLEQYSMATLSEWLKQFA